MEKSANGVNLFDLTKKKKISINTRPLSDSYKIGDDDQVDAI